MRNLSVSDKTYQRGNELEIYIQQNHERILQRALRLAASLAETVVSQEDLEHYCNTFRTEYVEIWHYVKRHFQGDTHKAVGQMDKKISEAEVSSNREHVHTLKEERRIVKLDRDRIELQYHWKQYWKILVAEVLIFSGDFIYNIFSFAVTGGNVLFAIFGSLVFSTVLGVAAIKIPEVLKRISDPRKRTGIAVLFGLGMFILFIVVAFLRSAVAVGNGTLTSLSTHVVIIGAVIFTVIQFSIFFFATLLAWFLPSGKDHRDKTAYDELDKKYNKMTHDIEALEGRNRAIPLETMRSLKDKVVIIQEENHHYEYIQSLSEKTVNTFRAEYRLRKRNETPLLS